MIICGRKKRNILKEIKKLRKKYKTFNVNQVVAEIENYYYKNEYSEKALFKRIAELRLDKEMNDNIFTLLVGLIVGIVIGFGEIFAKIIESNKSVIIKIKIIFTIIIIAVFITWTISLLKKIFAKADNGRNYYLDEKEIEIIKNIIENKGINRKVRRRT